MFVLASASKPRSKLLNQAQIDHKVIVSDVEESLFFRKDVRDLVQSLAIAKASSVLKKIEPSDNNHIFLLGCDSLFEFQGEVFGKPSNRIEAIDRWMRMSSNSGILHTGHCLIYQKSSFKVNGLNEFHKEKTGIVSTKINFSQVSKQVIENYVATKEPMKCAGGFALEGIGGSLIESIEGCYSNVIGLSLPWLRNALANSSYFL